MFRYVKKVINIGTGNKKRVVAEPEPVGAGTGYFLVGAEVGVKVWLRLHLR